MATRKRIRTTITEASAPPSEPEELDPFELAIEEFAGSEDIKLQIYRYDDDGRKCYVKQVPWNAQHHDLDWIRSKFGAGEYLLRFHDGNQRNRTKSRTVIIAPEPSSAPPAPLVVSDKSSEIVEILREQNKILLTAAVAKAGGGSGEGLTSDVLVKLLEGNQSLNNTLLSAVLSKGDTSTAIFEALQRGLQLASELKTEGEGGWLNALRGAAKDLMPLFQEIIKQRAAAGPRPIPVESRPITRPALAPPQGIANPPAEPPEASTPAASQSEEDMTNQTVNMFLAVTAPTIAEAAKRRECPQIVAEELLGEIGPNYYPVLARLTVDQVIEAAPTLSGHRGFVEQVLKAIQEAAKEDEETADADN